jgi:hypothetical protein
MKLKKLLFGLPFLLCINTLSAQSSCACNCIGQDMPHMILTDYDLSSKREKNFRNIKKKFLKIDFVQEFSLNLDALKQIFRKAIDKNASGLRVYFAQENNKPDDLSLVFVPTVPDPSNPGYHLDQADAYEKIEQGLNEASLIHISLGVAGTILANFRDGFKKESDAATEMASNGRHETISLFYSKDKIEELFNAIDTKGCLNNTVKRVGVEFVAYKADERIKDPMDSTKSKPVGNQLLIHFVLYDCQKMRIDLVKCYGHKMLGAADTGLPCPDFCY